MQENGCSGDFYIKQIKSHSGRQQFLSAVEPRFCRREKNHVCIYKIYVYMKIEAKVSMEMKGTSGRGGGDVERDMLKVHHIHV